MVALISVPLLLVGCEPPPPMVLSPEDNGDAFAPAAPAGDVVTFGGEDRPEGFGPEPVDSAPATPVSARPTAPSSPDKMDTTPMGPQG